MGNKLVAPHELPIVRYAYEFCPGTRSQKMKLIAAVYKASCFRTNN